MQRFLTKKYLFIGVGILLVLLVSYLIFKPKVDSSVQTEIVKKQNLKQTVLATGQVSSSTDLNLSFKGSGIVGDVKVKVGDQVKANDILANLTQKDQIASVTQARGSYASALANYNKVLAGASGPDIDIAKAAVASAETNLFNANFSYNATVKQQNTLVSSAQTALYNAGLAAKSDVIVPGSSSVTVTGAYSGSQSGVYNFTIYYSQGYRLQWYGIETGKSVDQIRSGIPLPLGTKGLYVTFSDVATIPTNVTWTVNIPNTESATYVTAYNSYQAAIQAKDQAILTAQNAISSAQAALDQAKSQLASKQSAARPEDVAVARAQLLSASGQVQGAEALLESTVIRAPADGTITTVDVKIGEQASPTKAAIVLQDVNSLHLEANISEANIASVKIGQPVDLTFDALGADRTFRGVVQLIDPASTVVSGVVNYKVTASVDNLPEIKPGMTANMTVSVGNKDNVLAISSRAVISRDGKKYVRLISDSKKKTYSEVEVETGMEADGGLVEITSGLTEGQEIVSFINKK